ncbi:MAG: hypothetical protein O7H39_09625, partial [Gammaproteobacteria bacterium]|nr:hypothetical protein [Gammaproteobacteria bacterium]
MLKNGAGESRRIEFVVSDHCIEGVWKTMISRLRVAWLLFLCSVCISVSIAAHQLASRYSAPLEWETQQISKTYAPFLPNYLDLAVYGAAGKVIDVKGKRCLQGTHFIFDVDNDYAYDLDETVSLTIEFVFPDGSSLDQFVIAYDK